MDPRDALEVKVAFVLTPKADTTTPLPLVYLAFQVKYGP